MSVGDDELYRQLATEYLYLLRWREKLFAGYFVLASALSLALYSIHTNDHSVLSLTKLGWVIFPAVGAALSFAFALFDNFITSARETLTAEVLAKEPLAGSLFASEVGVAGRPTNRFAG